MPSAACDDPQKMVPPAFLADRYIAFDAEKLERRTMGDPACAVLLLPNAVDA